MTHTADTSPTRYRVTVSAEVIDQAAKHVHHASVDILTGTDEQGDTVTFQIRRSAFRQLVAGAAARASIDVLVYLRDIITVDPKAKHLDPEDAIGDAREVAFTAYSDYQLNRRSGHNEPGDYRAVADTLIAYCVASGLGMYSALAEIHAAWERARAARTV